MDALLSTLLEFIPPRLLWGLFIFSIVAFVGTLLAIPAILVRLPADYFEEHHPRLWLAHHHPILRGLGLAIKNGVGLVFLLAGFAMLFLPGQGVLTMLIGISLLDFPGKQKLERKLITHPTVFKAVNALRHKFGKPPFSLSGKD